jgi:hypothetical protein
VGASGPPALPAACWHASGLELWEVGTGAGDVLAFELTPQVLAGRVGEVGSTSPMQCQLGSSSWTGQVTASPGSRARWPWEETTTTHRWPGVCPGVGVAVLPGATWCPGRSGVGAPAGRGCRSLVDVVWRPGVWRSWMKWCQWPAPNQMVARGMLGLESRSNSHPRGRVQMGTDDVGDLVALHPQGR